MAFSGYSEQTRQSLANVDEALVNTDLIEALVAHVLGSRQQQQQQQPGGGGKDDASAILIFAPGMRAGLAGWAAMQVARMLGALSICQCQVPVLSHSSCSALRPLLVCAAKQAPTRSAASAACCRRRGASRRRRAAVGCWCCRCTAGCRRRSRPASSTVPPRVSRSVGDEPASLAVCGGRGSLRPTTLARVSVPPLCSPSPCPCPRFRYCCVWLHRTASQAASRSWWPPTSPRRPSPLTT